MSYLKKTKSSSSLASSVSSCSSTRSRVTKPFVVSNRIYQQKESDDLTEVIDEARRNIALYKYASLKAKFTKLKQEETELMQSFEKLKSEHAEFTEMNKQSKQMKLRKLYLLKSANDVGDRLKQFSELILPYCQRIVPLMISDPQFDRLKESIESYSGMNLSGSRENENETIRNTLTKIDNLNLPEGFLSKLLDGQINNHVKKIFKQYDNQHQRILDLNQTTSQLSDILKNCKNNFDNNNGFENCTANK